MTTNTLRMAGLGALLALTVVLLQAHAIRFWVEAITGEWSGWGWRLLLTPWKGWGWAVALEAVALWSWGRTGRSKGWQRAAWAFLAVVVSLLLVFGPFYRVSDPLVRQLATPDVQVADGPRVRNVRAGIAGLEADAVIYRKTGATGNLHKTQRDLRANRAKLDGMLATQEREAQRRAGSLDWRRWLVIGQELAAIVVLQIVAALAYVAIFGGPSVPRWALEPLKRSHMPSMFGSLQRVFVPSMHRPSPATGDSTRSPTLDDLGFDGWQVGEQRPQHGATQQMQRPQHSAMDSTTTVAQSVRSMIDARKDGGDTVRSIASLAGVDRTTLSLAYHHESLSARAKRTVSEDLLTEIEGKLRRSLG